MCTMLSLFDTHQSSLGCLVSHTLRETQRVRCQAKSSKDFPPVYACVNVHVCVCVCVYGPHAKGCHGRNPWVHVEFPQLWWVFQGWRLRRKLKQWENDGKKWVTNNFLNPKLPPKKGFTNQCATAYWHPTGNDRVLLKLVQIFYTLVLTQQGAVWYRERI